MDLAWSVAGELAITARERVFHILPLPNVDADSSATARSCVAVYLFVRIEEAKSRQLISDWLYVRGV